MSHPSASSEPFGAVNSMVGLNRASRSTNNSELTGNSLFLYMSVSLHILLSEIVSFQAALSS